jgi:ribonuclease P protein component
MIGRTHRFHGYGSLRGVYQRGTTARTPLLNLRYATRDPKKPYRVAVVVSRKVNKSAVVRNRIRRRIYEIVRNHGKSIAPGTDLVFTVFNDRIADLEAPKLQATISELLQKATEGPSKGR